MGIKINDNDITYVDFNSNEIELATYNENIFYEKITLVDYVFPNENYGMSSNDSLGIKAYSDTIHSGYYKAWCAFDGTVSRYFCMDSADKGTRVAIVFPFDVYLTSITIKDSTTTPAVSSAWYAMLVSGNIYVSSEEKTAVFTDGEVYAELDRDKGWSTYKEYNAEFDSDNPYTTVHTNTDFESIPIRSICIDGTFHAYGSYRAIGDVVFTFKVNSRNLQEWAKTYNITL